MIDVYNSVTSLNVLLELKMPVKTSIKIVQLIQELNEHLKTAEKLRMDLISKYGKKNKEGNLAVPDSKKDQFLAELNKVLFETEVNITNETLKLADFDENFEISPLQLSFIKYLIDS